MSPGQQAAISIRSAVAADAPDCAALATQLGYPSQPSELVRRFETVLTRDDHAVFVALLDNRVVGWVHVHLIVSLVNELDAELGGLIVGEALRSRGIGRALVARSAEWAAAAGCLRLTVRSNTARLGAHEFYAALGFERTKTQHVYRRSVSTSGATT